jgi:hypothetical protein
MQKFEFLRQPLLGELAMSWREERKKREEKKMPFIVATYVYASSQGQRTHSAWTKNSPLWRGEAPKVCFRPNLICYNLKLCKFSFP